jgi:hypothetical protein
MTFNLGLIRKPEIEESMGFLFPQRIPPGLLRPYEIEAKKLANRI